MPQLYFLKCNFEFASKREPEEYMPGVDNSERVEVSSMYDFLIVAEKLDDIIPKAREIIRSKHPTLINSSLDVFIELIDVVEGVDGKYKVRLERM